MSIRIDNWVDGSVIGVKPKAFGNLYRHEIVSFLMQM